MRKDAFWSRPSRKGALCPTGGLQTAPFRHAAAPGECGATARQPAGYLGKWPNWANALGQPPASLRGGLRQGPQISIWSLASRKGALWSRPSRKDAFCVAARIQNAPFGEVRNRRAGQSAPFRNPLTTSPHAQGGHRSARRSLQASAQSKGTRPPARRGLQTRVWLRRPRRGQRTQARAPG